MLVDALTSADCDEIREWLSRTPPQIPPKWLYDARGSALYDQITRLPEYYPTRTERRILNDYAASIAHLTQAKTVIELGAGSPEKSGIVLQELGIRGVGKEFVPVDVSATYLDHIQTSMATTHPEVTVQPIRSDFTKVKPFATGESPRLVLFLGSTIGNLDKGERETFLAHVSAGLERGDFFLLGADLKKSRDRLIAAYHDSEGVTEAFIRNIGAVARTQWGATWPNEHFSYDVQWDNKHARIDMSLIAHQPTTVTIPCLDTALSFEAGDKILVETSHKFTRESITQELVASGLSVATTFTGSNRDFAVLLCTKP